jgi:hypothetical protein
VRWFRELLKKILPVPVVNWIRRWLNTWRYLRIVSNEVQARRSRLEDLESRVAARRDGFYQELVREVVERTDLILQQLDRRLEGQGARQGERLRVLEEEVARLRETLEDLKSEIDNPAVPQQVRASE